MICNYERDIVKRKAIKDLLAKKLSPATPRIARNRKNFPGDSSFLQLPNDQPIELNIRRELTQIKYLIPSGYDIVRITRHALNSRKG